MLTITLPRELETALNKLAKNKGTTPELLVLNNLHEWYLPETKSASPPIEGNLVDFLGDLIGCIHSSENVPGGAQMSTDSGRKFAAGMVKKRQAGKL